jgi:hypothetical protein
MKIRLNFVICAVLLLIVFGISHEALSRKPLEPVPAKRLTQAQKFLLKCGIKQKDIDIIPQLSLEAQHMIVEAAETGDCNDKDIVRFKNAREYVKLYYPPPQEPVNWSGGPFDSRFMTPAEQKYILACDEEIYKRLWHIPKNK